MTDARVLLLPGDGAALHKVDWRGALFDALLPVDVDPRDVVERFWEHITDPAYDLDKNP
jgi:hypothetical protein